MEYWTDITDASWEGVLHEGELALIDTATLTREMTKMAAEIQTMIASHSTNTISEDPLKIPPGFVGRALILIRDRVLTGIPNYTIDDDRREQAKRAEAWFLEVARGKIRPQPAFDAKANSAAPEAPAGIAVVSSRPSRTGSEKMNGL